MHSHKKQKDSLETWAKRAGLRTYFENEAMLEPNQNLNKRKARAIKTVCELPLYFPM